MVNLIDGRVHLVSLSQNPCVVQYLEHYHKFLVGTYELYSSLETARLKLDIHDDQKLKKTLKSINNRAGRFILIGGNDLSKGLVEYEFDCEIGGGVFDIKVKYDEITSSHHIYAAHSNGIIGFYKLSLNFGNKICLKEHTVITGSNMLTSIDLFPTLETDQANGASGLASSYSSSNGSGSSAAVMNHHSSSSSSSPSSMRSRQTSVSTQMGKLVVGDSKGFVTLVIDGEQIRASIADGDSIWQVKGYRLASERDIILVGAENSSWYIYAFDEFKRELVLLYKNSYKDFKAGITSITILNNIRSAEHDLLEILLGSYDETMQTYHIKINHEVSSKPDVCHKDTFCIENGGIWRVKPVRYGKKQLCIAAMYAGCYLMNLDEMGSQSDKKLQCLMDVESLSLNTKPLLYDIDVASHEPIFCMVDFNNSLCMLKTIGL